MARSRESRGEMEAFLREMSLGYLALCDGHQPYALPINYAYEEGRLLLHCALTGKKLTLLRQNPRVCFVVARQEAPVAFHQPGEVCHVPSMSVVCFGTARVVDDPGEREAILNTFLRRYQPDAPPLPAADVRSCGCVEILVAEMTGRREGPGKREVACWRWCFPPAPDR